MSHLEVAVQRYVGAMMSGFSITLNPEAQGIVATWATKTAFMLTYTSPGQPPIHRTHLRWLYEERTPPAGTWCWLAAYAGKRHGLLHIESFTLSGTDEAGVATNAGVHLVTFALDSLIVQVWVWADPRHEALPIPFPHSHANVARRIWPADGFDVRWPPSVALDFQGFKALSAVLLEMR